MVWGCPVALTMSIIINCTKDLSLHSEINMKDQLIICVCIFRYAKSVDESRCWGFGECLLKELYTCVFIILA